MLPTIETERLRLRQIDLKDSERLFTIFSDPNVLRYYGMEPHASLSETEQMLTGMLEGIESGAVMRWGIVTKESSNLIGTIGFHNRAPRHRRAEVGYEIHPNYWRHGYATEALHAALSYAGQTGEIERVGAVVFTENVASQQMLEKNGFSREGTLRHYVRQGERAHDVHVYGYTTNKDHADA
ncbi:GNAT family N-acetyltransferase [Exiguobacterium sp. E4787]|uniref:GNAT family N-acetyltransferase n=1 Tax=Exiguobacterium sp. E4787 TaxID=2751225 RepID=UPI001BE78FC6|nr:GNAT family N-acetyltransferase [Exiguobacterium sp. E4787]